MINLYKKTIEILLSKGYICKIFTNGYSKDYEFGQMLKQEFEDEERVVLLDIPKSSEELITYISEFQGMITARLHSLMVAYSFFVPTVAISWEQKVTDFLNLVNSLENIVNVFEDTPEKIVNKLEIALKEGYDMERYNSLREQSKNK